MQHRKTPIEFGRTTTISAIISPNNVHKPETTREDTASGNEISPNVDFVVTTFDWV